MIKKLSLTFALLFSANLWACSPPPTPEIPDATTAVTPQMIKAKNDIKTFMGAAETYLGCVKSNRKHDFMVAQMQDIAKQFNDAIKVFKARM